jgi:hypothetical protein
VVSARREIADEVERAIELRGDGDDADVGARVRDLREDVVAGPLRALSPLCARPPTSNLRGPGYAQAVGRLRSLLRRNEIALEMRRSTRERRPRGVARASRTR